jgi:predicted ABC-type ATPase
VNLRPVLIVVAGPNGSGKTSLTRKLVMHEWAEAAHYINPDDIARERFGDWNSATAIRQAAEFAEQWRAQLVQAGESFCFETVLSTQNKVDFLLDCKRRGYFVRMFFVGTESPEINAARVARRVMSGGHDVPIPKIISRYIKSMSNSIAVARQIDRAYFYDNSVEDADPRIVLRMTDGEITKVYEERIPGWMQTLIGEPVVESEAERVARIDATVSWRDPPPR